MGRGAGELAERMRSLHRHIARLQAELVHCVGEFDAVQGYGAEDCRSTPAWLRGELRMHPREATQILGMARQLRHLPVFDAAFAAGEISQAHVAVLTHAARQIGAEHVAAMGRELLASRRTAARRSCAWLRSTCGTAWIPTVPTGTRSKHTNGAS